LVVLDTETTGLDATAGHRVIEVGGVAISDRKHSDEQFHSYLNPERSIDAAALEVHGITESFLADKPLFKDVLESFFKFVTGAELVIHNAPFDLGFLNNELELAGDPRRLEDFCTVTDTLKLARELHPGQRNSLDALCRRYGVDNSGRTLHGALLDAEILADVYLAMTGGQTDLQLEGVLGQIEMDRQLGRSGSNAWRNFAIISASDEELTAHRKWVELLGASSVWNSVDSSGDNESG
jgi:DNA polymerase-3 subunit epsilon